KPCGDKGAHCEKDADCCKRFGGCNGGKCCAPLGEYGCLDDSECCEGSCKGDPDRGEHGLYWRCCFTKGKSCSSDHECCSENCDHGKCGCRPTGLPCAVYADCCGICRDGKCYSRLGDPCSDVSDCFYLECVDGVCCRGRDKYCDKDGDCCGDLTCRDGHCH
ncbi:MAG: hypothetical protein GXP49_17010, partial [Deltaproteobacteria bacterium]|nr:hypothetical protein [Deltaproteobacteria bacterium]